MSAETNAKAPVNADPALPPIDKSSAKVSDGKLPITPEMPGTEGKSANKSVSFGGIPTDISSMLSTTDTTIERLAKLLKTPGGLASFLSTVNYGLYIAAFAHMSAPTRAQVIAFISKYIPGRTAPKVAPGALKPVEPSSPLLPLALTIGDLRTTLRLTGLIPLYVLLKSLIKNRDAAKDKVLNTIQITQAIGYIGFQFFENVFHLTNKTVVNANWTNARFARFGGHAKLSLWSCRAWLTAVTCEFLRLFREAQLAREDGSDYSKMTAEEKKSADKKWWAALFSATSWYPMAVHYSLESGMGLNLGMVGACGFFANVGTFLQLWEATK